MEQVYYTQEGKAYVLKTISKKTIFAESFANFYYALVYVNNTLNPLPTDKFSVTFNTTKKIIPVRACFTANSSSLGTPLIDIQSVYYSLVRGNSALVGANSFDHINALSKMSPLAERIFYTSENNYSYNIKYGEAVVSENDFINPSGGCVFFFTPSLAIALNDFVQANISTVSDSYSTNVVFTYFELQ